MQSAVVHLQGTEVKVVLSPMEGETTGAEGDAHAAVDTKDPGPIVPEAKELAWSFGAFVVFALLLRFYLFPKLKKGMEARNASIRNSHDTADAARTDARAEVADYEAQLAAIKAEAARKIDAARGTLEGERQAQLAEVNARLAEQRAAATAQAEAARLAVQDQVAAAVGDVAGQAATLATGRRPSPEMVSRVVGEVMAR